MHLKKLFECFDYKITGGSIYCWECYGDNARYIDFESEYAHGYIIFDAKDQTAYCAEVITKEHKYQYRWMNPIFVEAFRQEAKEKNVDPDQAWDDIKWTDIDLIDDFTEKANAIFNGKDFDTRVQIEVNLDDDTLMLLFQEAHKRDITFNQLVEDAVKTLIDEYERDPESVKSKMDKLLSTNISD